MWIALMTSVSFIIVKRRLHEEFIHGKSKISRTQPLIMIRSSAKAELAFTTTIKVGNCLV